MSKRINNNAILRTNKNECYFCLRGIDRIDYKNIDVLKYFIDPFTGKIKSRRISKVCAKHQRALSNAIKKARIVALLPFVID